MVDRRLFSNFLDPPCDRRCFHLVAQTLVCGISSNFAHRLKSVPLFAQKKKWAKTHRITPPKIRVRNGIIRSRSHLSKGRSYQVPEIAVDELRPRLIYRNGLAQRLRAEPASRTRSSHCLARS